jgi:hypothetical protein
MRCNVKNRLSEIGGMLAGLLLMVAIGVLTIYLIVSTIRAVLAR